MGIGDLVVFFLVVAGLFIWIGVAFKRWLERPWTRSAPYAELTDAPSKELVSFLAQHGYETIGGKYKFVLHFSVNDRTLRSRLYIDGIARSDDGVFVVKKSRPRQPMEWTGGAVRDAFLPLFAVAGRINGILYVDPVEERLVKIRLEVEE